MAAPAHASASILNHSDLRQYFAELYAQAHARNPRLSHAAFARYLKCSAPAWSNFLEGRRMLSEAKLAEIGRKLGWRTDELAHALHIRFIGELDANDDYAECVRATARTRRRSTHRKSETLADEGANLDFIAVVMKESVALPDYAADPLRCAAKLGIDPKFALRVLERLVASGTLVKDETGAYRKASTATNVFVSADRSRVLRDYYRQALAETSKRIRAETTDRRYLGSETIAFDPADLPEAKRIIDRCLDDLTALSYRCANPSSVFHAGVQFVEILEASE